MRNLRKCALTLFSVTFLLISCFSFATAIWREFTPVEVRANKVRDALVKAMLIKNRSPKKGRGDVLGRKTYVIQKSILEKLLETKIVWTYEGFSFAAKGQRVRVVLIGGLQRRVTHRRQRLEWSFLPGPPTRQFMNRNRPTEPVYVIGDDGTICRFDDPYYGESNTGSFSAAFDEELFKKKLERLDDQSSKGDRLNAQYVEISDPEGPPRHFWLQPDGTMREFEGAHGRGPRCTFSFEKGKSPGKWQVVFTPDDSADAGRFFPIEVCDSSPLRRPAFWNEIGGVFMYISPPTAEGAQPIRFFNFWDKGQFYPEMSIPPGRPYWVNGSCVQYYDEESKVLHLTGICWGASTPCSVPPEQVIEPVMMGRQDSIRESRVVQVGADNRGASLVLLTAIEAEIVRWKQMPGSEESGIAWPLSYIRFEEEPRIHAPWTEGRVPPIEDINGIKAFMGQDSIELCWIESTQQGIGRILQRSINLTSTRIEDRSIRLPDEHNYELIGYNRPYFVLLQKSGGHSLVFLDESNGVKRVTPLPKMQKTFTAEDCRVIWGEEEIYPMDSLAFWRVYQY